MIILGLSGPSQRPEGSVAASSVVVVYVGELDFASTSALDVLDEAVRTHPGAHILVDLSAVTFMDSTALVAFAQARSTAAAAGGAVSLHGASAFVLRMLEIWRLEPAPSVAREPGGAPMTDGPRRSGLVPRPRPRGDGSTATASPRVWCDRPA